MSLSASCQRSISYWFRLFYSGLEIRCRSDEWAIFTPPSGQTCQQWAGDFVNVFGGYLDNGNDTSSCRYCQYSSGDDFYTPLNIDYGNRWRDVFIIFAFFGKFCRRFHASSTVCLTSVILQFSTCSPLLSLLAFCASRSGRACCAE